jgi:phosphoglycerol transferase MdoB-like AlkP superfamily enzyme
MVKLNYFCRPMLRSLFTFIRFFIFWLLFFAITRATFEIYFSYKLHGVSTADIIRTFLYGIRMDASATAYIAIIPLLVFIVNWFIGNKPIKSIWLKIYTWFCLFFISLIAIVDLGIFTEWGAKVNFRAFDTLYNSPAESMSSTASSPIALHLTIGVILLVLGSVLSHFIIDYSFKKPIASTKNKVLFSVLLLLVNFVILRGSLMPAPINQSAGYFSDNQLLDLAAQNTEWNLANNIFENLRHPYNPYQFMPATQAKKTVDELFEVKTDTTVHVLTTDKPNVVIIQLESFTADVIESLGGEKGDAPNIENFIKSGILFNNIYAAGDRTDKGIIAILSGFPSQAIRTIIIDTPKQKKLPSLMTEFKDNGYKTSYFYGGTSDYMNFDTYMQDHKTDRIFDSKYIDKKDVQSTWGAHDNVLFNKHVGYLSKETTPFFSLIQTLTNHEPFALPVPPHFKGKDLSDQFRSTAWFTDSCLNAYFESAKKHDWYKNTLFVLVADHGHRLPRNILGAYNPAKYHIPLVFFGDVIKPEYRGIKITKLGTQTDIAATILAQLNFDHKDFKWSKNLLNPYSKEFAFFDWDNGFGFMLPEQAISYDNSGQRLIYRKNKNADHAATQRALIYGKAFIQQIYTEYLAY